MRSKDRKDQKPPSILRSDPGIQLQKAMALNNPKSTPTRYERSDLTPMHTQRPPAISSKKPNTGRSHPLSGSILQSFAKSSVKPIVSSTTTDQVQSIAVTPKILAARSDGDESEDEGTMLLSKPKSSLHTSNSRTSREAGLRRMMEQDDDGASTASPPLVASKGLETPLQGKLTGDAEEINDDVQLLDRKIEPKPRTAEVGPAEGRRRGKRRVLRKKQVHDDEGYLGKFGGYRQLVVLRPSDSRIHNSHRTRTSLGVILGRRDHESSPGRRIWFFSFSCAYETKETTPQRSRKYHVVFYEENLKSTCLLNHNHIRHVVTTGLGVFPKCSI